MSEWLRRFSANYFEEIQWDLKVLSPPSQNFLGFDFFISKQSFQNQCSLLCQHESQCSKQHFNQNKENLTLGAFPPQESFCRSLTLCRLLLCSHFFRLHTDYWCLGTSLYNLRYCRDLQSCEKQYSKCLHVSPWMMLHWKYTSIVV